MNTPTIRSFALALLMLGSASIISPDSYAQQPVQVGGAPMYPTKNIIENAVNSKDHTILVKAVKAAGLVETLSGKGPFTVFAPTNNAFDKVPEQALENLMKPENKKQLTNILTYHVVAGTWDAAKIADAVKNGKGKAALKTVQGEMLTLMMKGKELWVVDAKGNRAMITISDVYQSNGVIHVIDQVMMP